MAKVRKPLPAVKVRRKPIVERLKKGGKTVAPSLLTLFPEYRRSQYLARVTEQQKQFLGQLQDAYRYRGLVLYLGAGVSRSIGLPSWPELIRSLTVTMMTQKVTSAVQELGGLSDEKYWQRISAIQEDIETKADYDKPILMMARAIKDVFGEDLPPLVARNLYMRSRMNRFIVERYYYQRKKRGSRSRRIRLPSSSLIDAIVALARSERDVKGVQAVVNYNYDDLIDEKLREENVRCITVRSGRDRVLPGILPCYHVHGVLPVSNIGNLESLRKQETRGNFVFSEDEYHAEYSDPYKWSNMTQMSLLGRFTGLFIGLSMEDPNIRRLIDVTHRQYPDISNYAVMTRKTSLSKSKDSKESVLRNLFEEVETTSFAKIGVKVAWLDDYGDIPHFLNKICNFDSPNAS